MAASFPAASSVPVQRFRGGLVFKAHRLLYHSTLGWRVIKKKKKAPSPIHSSAVASKEHVCCLDRTHEPSMAASFPAASSVPARQISV